MRFHQRRFFSRYSISSNIRSSNWGGEAPGKLRSTNSLTNNLAMYRTCDALDFEEKTKSRCPLFMTMTFCYRS